MKVGGLMIPKQVRVAGITYSVEEKEVVIIDGSSNYMGSCNHLESKIQLKSDLSVERKQETFIHELFHAVLNEAGYDNHDEEMVERASKVLYQVFKDNNLSFQS